MKHFTLAILFLVLMMSVQAQSYLTQEFTASTWPPTGWTFDGQPTNWSRTNTSNAGGSAGEARFTWQPEFNGTTRFISPAINLTGVNDVALEFNHNIDHYGGPYIVGAATRSGGGSWNVIWQMTGAGTPATQVIQLANNNDVGAADFQFCFFFTGNSYNINHWYIDNVRLFTPAIHDAAVMSIGGGTYYNPNDSYAASAVVRNAGLNIETFDVALEISNLDGVVLYTENKTVNNLGIGETMLLNFNPYTLANANEAYEVTVIVSLDTDMNDSNDQLSKYVYTYTTPKDQVVLEIGTGTWCVYCPGAAMGAHDLIENGHNVSVIKYHSGDSYEIPASASRVSYYSIAGFPTSIFDGVESIVGGSSNQSLYPAFVPLVEARNLIRTAFDMDFAVPVQNDASFSVLAMINKMGPALQNNLRLHFAVTESNIPQNWFNQTEVDNVLRLMLPSAAGTAIDMSQTDYMEVQFDFTLQPNWVLDNMEVIIFVQDNNTKEILNSIKRNLNELTSVKPIQAEKDDILVYPNPVTGESVVTFSLSANEQADIRLIDMGGRTIAILDATQTSNGNNQLVINGKDYSPGVYFVQLRSNERLITKKLVIR
jgi:hypothetical protein